MPDLDGYRFTSSHEWVHVEDGTARIGITDYAQAQLGDVIFLELPEAGRVLAPGERFGLVESVKAASDLYAPVGGRVVEANGALTDTPEAVNQDPYGAGWMLLLEDLAEPEEGGLLSQADYDTLTADSG